MKTQFIAEDGKIFNSKEAALAHEAAIKNSDSYKTKEELLKKLKANDEKIKKLEKEIKEISNESVKLIDNWEENYATPEDKERMKKLDRFFNIMFGN